MKGRGSFAPRPFIGFYLSFFLTLSCLLILSYLFFLLIQSGSNVKSASAPTPAAQPLPLL